MTTLKDSIEILKKAGELFEQGCMLVGRFLGEYAADAELSHDSRQQLQSKVIPMFPHIDNSYSVKEIAMTPKEESLPYLSEGTIRKRKDGRWEIRIMYHGKQISIIHKNQKECLKRYKIKLKERDNGIEYKTEKPKCTLFTWLDEWFTLYKEGKVSEGWARKIKTCIKVHIKNCFKDYELDKLDAIEIEKNIDKVKSSRMREDVCVVLNSSLKMAFKKKLMKENIMIQVEKYKHKRINGKAFEAKEQEAFLKHAKENSAYYEIYLFYLNTGARPDEIKKIRECDINLNQKTIFINGTKTPTSKRTVPLFSPLFEIAKAKASTSEKPIFDFHPEALRRDFKNCIKSIGLNPKSFTIKSMRHSYGTRLFERGIDLQTVSKWMGHVNTEITRRVYVKLLSEYEKLQAIRFDPNSDPKS